MCEIEKIILDGIKYGNLRDELKTYLFKSKFMTMRDMSADIKYMCRVMSKDVKSEIIVGPESEAALKTVYGRYRTNMDLCSIPNVGDLEHIHYIVDKYKILLGKIRKEYKDTPKPDIVSEYHIFRFDTATSIYFKDIEEVSKYIGISVFRVRSGLKRHKEKLGGFLFAPYAMVLKKETKVPNINPLIEFSKLNKYNLVVRLLDNGTLEGYMDLDLLASKMKLSIRTIRRVINDETSKYGLMEYHVFAEKNDIQDEYFTIYGNIRQRA